ncbi:MAG: tetratricopeptide repeat protein [Cyanobacteriota bacterium]
MRSYLFEDFQRIVNIIIYIAVIGIIIAFVVVFLKNNGIEISLPQIGPKYTSPKRIEKRNLTQKSEYYSNKGYSEYKFGNYSKAIDLFEDALALNARNATAHYGIGASYFKMHSYDRAAGYLRYAILLGYNDPEAYIMLATIYEYNGYLERAIKYNKKVLKFDPSNYKARRNIDNLTQRLNNLKRK